MCDHEQQCHNDFERQVTDLMSLLRLNTRLAVEHEQGYLTQSRKIGSKDLARGNAKVRLPRPVREQVSFSCIFNVATLLFEPKTWSTFNSNWQKQNIGLFKAVSFLLAEVTTCAGVNLAVDFSVSSVVTFIEDYAQKHHPGMWSKLSPTQSSVLKGVGAGAVVTLVLEAMRYAYHSHQEHKSADPSTRARSAVIRNQILSADNLFRHLVSLGTAGAIAPFVGTSMAALVAAFVCCQLALLLVEVILKKKNKAGGWKEFVRPYFSYFGLMVAAADMHQNWNVPDDLVIPNDMCCPIGQELFVQPMVDKYGHVYERSFIMQWLQINQTSPKTKGPLNPRDLRRCHEMESIVYKFTRHHGIQLQ